MKYKIVSLKDIIKGYEALPNETLVIKGEFKFKKLNHLHFCDDMLIECYCLDLNIKALESKPIILLNWKLLKGPKNYIEIKSFAIVPAEFILNQFSHRDLREARLVAENRSILEERLNVENLNLKEEKDANLVTFSGVVLFKSCLLQSKDSFLFILKVDSLFIVLSAKDQKGMEELNNYYQTIKLRAYKFKDLSRKKIKLEKNNEYTKIYQFNNYSRMIELSDIATLAQTNRSKLSRSQTAQPISSQQLSLEVKFFHSQLTQTKSKNYRNQEDNCFEETIVNQDPDYFKKTIIYQGTITRIFNCTIGLYEIDMKFKLFMSHYNFSHLKPFIRPGVLLNLENVHVILKANEILFLVPCVISNIEIIKYSTSEPVSTMIYNQSYFGPLNLNLFKQTYANFNVHDIIFYSAISDKLQEFISNDKFLFDKSVEVMKKAGFTELFINPHSSVLTHDSDCRSTVKRYLQKDIIAVSDLFLMKSVKKVTVVDCILIANIFCDLCGLIVRDSSSSIRAIFDVPSQLILNNAKNVIAIHGFELINESDQNIIRFEEKNIQRITPYQELQTNQKPSHYFTCTYKSLVCVEFDEDCKSRLFIVVTGKIDSKKCFIKFVGDDSLIGHLLVVGNIYGIRIPFSRIKADDEILISWNEKCQILTIEDKVVEPLFDSVNDVFDSIKGSDRLELVNVCGVVQKIDFSEDLNEFHSTFKRRLGLEKTMIKVAISSDDKKRVLEVKGNAGIKLYGIVHGSYLSFENLLLQTDSLGKISAKIVPSTGISISKYSRCSKRSKIKDLEPRITSLLEVLQDNYREHDNSWILCMITKILYIELYFYCTGCERKNYLCKCGGTATIEGNARLSVDDGTMEYTLILQDLKQISKLLAKQKTVLEKELAANEGILILTMEPWLSEIQKQKLNNHTLDFRRIVTDKVLRRIKFKIDKQCVKPRQLFGSGSRSCSELKQRAFRNLEGRLVPSLCYSAVKVLVSEFFELDLKTETMALLKL